MIQLIHGRILRPTPLCVSALALLLSLCNPALGQQSEPALAGLPSIRSFGVASTNSAAVNRAHLQKAIDWAARRGAALFVEPTEEPYPMGSGLVLRMNVSLVGVHGPVGRGTRHPDKAQPVGSVFRIEDS